MMKKCERNSNSDSIKRKKTLYEYEQRLKEKEKELTQRENQALETPPPMHEPEPPQFSGRLKFHTKLSDQTTPIERLILRAID